MFRAVIDMGFVTHLGLFQRGLPLAELDRCCLCLSFFIGRQRDLKGVRGLLCVVLCFCEVSDELGQLVDGTIKSTSRGQPLLTDELVLQVLPLVDVERATQDGKRLFRGARGDKSTGTDQGSPDSPALFCAALAPALGRLHERLAADGGGAWADMDDAYAVGSADTVFAALRAFADAV